MFPPVANTDNANPASPASHGSIASSPSTATPSGRSPRRPGANPSPARPTSPIAAARSTLGSVRHNAMNASTLAKWESCAYQFRVVAWARTTNGYGRVYRDDFFAGRNALYALLDHDDREVMGGAGLYRTRVGPGAIEIGMMNAAVCQMARYYNVPAGGYLGLTNSKITDAQAGFEKGMSPLLGATSGVDFIVMGGLQDALMTFDFAQAVIDNEIALMIKRVRDLAVACARAARVRSLR